MATPRQQVLIEVLNYMHTKNLSLDFGGTLDAEMAIYKNLSKSAQRWLENVRDVAHWKFSAEVISYLEKGIILDYSDLEPGGRYGTRKEKQDE